MEYLIAHRGNINGKSCKENSPLYIDNAIKKGFDVEIDIWYYNKELKLGHDYPEYRIDFEKSIKLIGNKYFHANGSDVSITNNNAGSIRLIRLS